MYIFIYIYTYVHIYVYTYIYLYIYMYIYIHIFIDIHIFIYVYTYIYICMRTCKKFAQGIRQMQSSKLKLRDIGAEARKRQLIRLAQVNTNGCLV